MDHAVVVNPSHQYRQPNDPIDHYRDGSKHDRCVGNAVPPLGWIDGVDKPNGLSNRKAEFDDNVPHVEHIAAAEGTTSAQVPCDGEKNCHYEYGRKQEFRPWQRRFDIGLMAPI